MALPLRSPVLPQLARSRDALPDGRRLGLRAQARRLPRHRLRRRRRGRAAVAQRQGADPLLPRGGAFAGRRATCSTARSSSRPRSPASTPLGQRIHPAKSRIDRLASETPARLVAFDLLARDDDVLLELPYLERRAALEAFVEGLELTPVVRTRRRGRALAARGGGRHRQGGRRPLQPGRAGRHGQDQARPDDRRGRHGLAAGQGRGHGRGADPRPLRRGRPAARGRPLVAASRPRRSASSSPRSRRTRPASAARRARRGGRPAATWSGSPCGPSSSSRSPSTTSPTAGSATGPRCSAGATTSRPRPAPLDQLDS